MASTRLPGKPLADIAGAPMIVHVWRQAARPGVGPVVVACGRRRRSPKRCAAAGGEAVLTDPALPSGSDRIFAALAQLDPDAPLRRGRQPAGRYAVVDPRRRARASLGR